LVGGNRQHDPRARAALWRHDQPAPVVALGGVLDDGEAERVAEKGQALFVGRDEDCDGG
jgi:hypothetical protein